jgi:phosphate transport system substrate-binding protein
VGASTSVNWPGRTIGGQGNEGVAGAVRNTPGAIGYAELSYAKQNRISYAQVKNKSGRFIEPTANTATAAVEGVTLPDNLEAIIVDSANPNAYPIVGFTWLLVYENYPDRAKATSIAHLAWWLTHDAQKHLIEGYAPLSADVQGKVEAMLKEVKSGGQPVLHVP